MILYWKFALRNLFRNGRRTLLTLLVLIFSVAVLILYSGFSHNVLWGMRESIIQSQTGHFQIYRKGFLAHRDDYSLNNLLSHRDVTHLERALEKVPHIVAQTRRANFVGLIGHGEKTLHFLGRAVDPEAEREFQGFLPIVEGVDLSPSDDRKVILGVLLAEKLGVRVGGRVTLISSTIDGAINAVDCRVLGLFESGVKEYDGAGLILPLRTFFGVIDTQEIQRMVVLIHQTAGTDAAVAQLKVGLGARAGNFEIANWSDLADDYHKVAAMYNTVFSFMFAILAVISVLSILNTLLMSAFERTREIGTQMALGTRGGRIIQLFLLEGFLLGVMGGGVGLCVGVLFAKLLSLHGIPMPPPPGMTKGFLITIDIVPAAMYSAFALSIICSTLASLLVAARITRRPIVEALRHV